MIDFSLAPEVEAIRLRTKAFVAEHIIPLEADRGNYDEHENIRGDLMELLRGKAREAGLWAPQVPKERGGMGLSMTAQAVMYEEANYSIFGPVCFNCAAPDDGKKPLCILMHGDREVSAKNLARAMATKTVAPCTPEVADRHSGYQVGGTSPFGLRRAMPIYMERTILELPRIYINGGARGFLVAIDPREAERVLAPTLVDVAV